MSIFLVLQVLRRRGWLVGLTFISTLAGALLLLAVIPSRYEGVAVASIDPSRVDPVSGLTSTNTNAMLIIQGNLVALAKSNQVALAVVKRLDLTSDPASQAAFAASKDSGLISMQQWVASQLIANVSANFGMQSDVLTITYKSPNPQQAATLANAFMSAFIDVAIALKVSEASRAADWYTPQLDKIRSSLAASREKLARFQTEAKLLNPTTIGDSENNQLVSVGNDLAKARADLLLLKTQYDSPAPTTGATSNDAQSIDLQTLGTLRANLSALDSEIARTQTETGANNPRLLEKVAQRQAVQKQIQSAIDDYRKKLADRIATQTERVEKLEKAYAERLTDMIGVQGQRNELTSLTREVTFRQEELERLEKAASQARLQSQLSFSDISLIDPATPPTAAAFPKPIIVIALALVLGVGLGLLLALIAEALDRRLRTADDLPFATNAPLLGVMTNVKPKKRSRLKRLLGAVRLPRLGRRGSSKTEGLLAGP